MTGTSTNRSSLREKSLYQNTVEKDSGREGNVQKDYIKSQQNKYFIVSLQNLFTRASH